MRRVFRWFGYGFGGIAALALLAAGYIWYASSSQFSRVHAAAPEPLAASPRSPVRNAMAET